MPFEKQLEELERRRARALEMGGLKRSRRSTTVEVSRPGRGSTGSWIPAPFSKWAARVINYMNALALVTVPKISIVVRKTYGMAYWNMCGSGAAPDVHVAWPTAEMSFVDPAIAANVVHGGKESADNKESEEWQDLMHQPVDDASPYGAAGRHYLHDVIDPRETRDYIIKALEISHNARKKGLSEHKLANWPTKF